MRSLFHSCGAVALALITCTAFCSPDSRPGLAPAADPTGSRLAYLEYDASSVDFRLVVESLGSGERQVVDADLPALIPAWSPDGKVIAYVKYDASASAVLSLVNLSSGGRTTFSLGELGPPVSLCWISSESLAIGGEGTIQILDAGTGRLVTARDLSTFGLKSDFNFLSINTAGVAALIADRNSADHGSIWILPLRGAAAPREITHGHDDASPVWIDDHQIVFSRAGAALVINGFKTIERHLWVVDVGTGKTRQITAAAAIDGTPTVNAHSVFFMRIAQPSAKSKAKPGEELGEFFLLGEILSVDRAELSRH